MKNTIDFVGADSTSLALRSKFAKQTLHPPEILYVAATIPIHATRRHPLIDFVLRVILERSIPTEILHFVQG